MSDSIMTLTLIVLAKEIIEIKEWQAKASEAITQLQDTVERMLGD